MYDGFAAEGQNIGRLIVRQQNAKRGVPRAFRAWCDAFMARFEAVRARDGGWWSLKEMTFDLFVQCLYAMPKQKASGAGGLTRELLIHAGPEWQLLFYE